MLIPPSLRAAGVAVLSVVLTACSKQEHSLPATFQHVLIDSPDLFSFQDDVAWIDVRSPDAFNGWLIHDGQTGADRGGHIPGAQLFSAIWVERGLTDLDRAWERTNITAQQSVILYGDNIEQTNIVARWLVSEQKLAAENIQLLADNFTVLQAAYESRVEQHLDSLPGYRSLVPPEYIAGAVKNTPVIVVQVGWDGRGRDYRERHIPGAVYWDDGEFEVPPIYEARSADEIRTSLARLGIHKDSSVIVYSTDSIGAARGAVIMKYAGVEDVVMLNGGMTAWQAAGFEVERGWQEPVPISEFGMDGPGDSSIMVDIDEAAYIRRQENSALVSIRAWQEFSGAVSGYNYFSKRGRIPGALWGHAGDTSWDMNHFHNPDNTMRNYHQIAEFWREWGIRPDMTLSFYCGNGWRASEAWWYAQAMGFENTTVYSSGWMRWREDERAVASGDLSREQVLAEWRWVSDGMDEARLVGDL